MHCKPQNLELYQDYIFFDQYLAVGLPRPSQVLIYYVHYFSLNFQQTTGVQERGHSSLRSVLDVLKHILNPCHNSILLHHSNKEHLICISEKIFLTYVTNRENHNV